MLAPVNPGAPRSQRVKLAQHGNGLVRGRSSSFRILPGLTAYSAAAISWIRLRSLFLTLPTRVRTGQQVIGSDG
jgi:hypothetical protein